MDPTPEKSLDPGAADSHPRTGTETPDSLAARATEQQEALAAAQPAPPVRLQGRLGFVIIAHDFPDNTARLVTRLLEQGAVVSLHWDARHPEDLAIRLQKELPAELAGRLVAARRVAVHWGLWTVVEATLCGLEAIEQSGLTVSHVTLLSGHDYPLRPVSELRAFLASHPGLEHIECVDHEKERWVTDGLHDERWQYRHYVSWGTHPWWFDRCWHLQRLLGLKRKPLRGYKPHFGSQWWTLSWPTLRRILAASREPRTRRFFKRTWVPDEMFFQTMVGKFVPPERISGKNLNFYHFNKQGIPLVFYNDHLHFLREQPHFFARKISPRAAQLRDQLDDLIRERECDLRPPAVISKKIETYQVFEALQYRGLPNRRVLGAQRDLWWGDMEWNKRPYTAIIAPESCSLDWLWSHFAALPGFVSYGDLFHPKGIHYGPHASPHPLYPEDAPMLRDLKKPNFLFDLIQRHPDKRVVFSIRVPSHTEIPDLAIADVHCDMVFVQALTPLIGHNGRQRLHWKSAFEEMVVSDLYWQARKNGKEPLVVSSPESLALAKTTQDIPPPRANSQPDTGSLLELKKIRQATDDLAARIAAAALALGTEIEATAPPATFRDEFHG